MKKPKENMLLSVPALEKESKRVLFLMK